MNVNKKAFVSCLILPGCLFATAQVKKAVPAKPGAPVVSLKTTTDSLSYAIGLSVANFYKQQNITQVNTALVTKAINDVTKKGTPLLTDEQATACISAYIQKTKTAQASVAKKAGDAFLAANKNKPGVTTLASGLQYIVIKEGDGPKPALTDKIKCHYHGTLIDGRVFDSSIDRGEPIELTVNQVIPGWTEALQLMPVGSKWKLFVPSSLAYGDQQAGPLITPGSTLIFDVELLAIEK